MLLNGIFDDEDLLLEFFLLESKCELVLCV